MYVLNNDLLHLDDEKQTQDYCLIFISEMTYFKSAVGILAGVFIMTLIDTIYTETLETMWQTFVLKNNLLV